jgi:RNA polymerase sigma-B factor
LPRARHDAGSARQPRSALRAGWPPPAAGELFERCHAGDAGAREQLVARFAPLATRAAARYRNSSEPRDDLEQVALIGLIKAIDSFDAGRATAFGSYALPMILGELRHHFRDHTWVLYVPSHVRELAQRVSSATATLSDELRREPTVLEVAEQIGASDEDVLEARAAIGARRTLSLGGARTAFGNFSDDAMTLEDAITVVEEGYARAEDRAMLEALLRTLSARQRVVLSLRFEHDLTQSQIASVVGISQMHVSRIIRDGLARMRALDAVEFRRVRRLSAG